MDRSPSWLAVLLLLGAAGCYDFERLSSGKARDLAVPDLIARDLGRPDLGPRDLAPPADLAGPDLASDLAVVDAPPPDLARADLTPYGCRDAFTCFQGCTTNEWTCMNACRNRINTEHGVEYIDGFYACLELACPSTTGAICGPTSPPGPCGACTSNAQSVGGACIGALNTCKAD